MKAFEIYHSKEKDIDPLIKMGMNENSAKDTIRCFGKLLKGESPSRRVQLSLIKFLLQELYTNNRREDLGNVLRALDKHYEIRSKRYGESNESGQMLIDKYTKKLYGHKVSRFFAYHGPQNPESFDYKGGYGVSQESKWSKVNDDDLVYVIQNVYEKFEFCGIYRILSHYKNEHIGSKNHFRFQLEDITCLINPIDINEDLCGRRLPQLEKPANWSNFKRHFCSQGATFRNPLSSEVFQVLDSLLPDKRPFQFAEEISENEEMLFFEGAKQTVTINKYERDHNARKACIEYHGYNCKVCGFDFEKTYGELGRNYIHVHHLIPLSKIGKEYSINPQTDLIPVCPNCHAMLHKSENPNDLYSLKKMIQK
ncbi:HNH endonuclease [Desulforapulum autotrophicum]|uniref:HNH endonuclease n=1 Tax=Desulforapulum autotrophicum TaxID=2296 RepID=UPI001930C196|nr:HNH endonuclease [Desulforapulum autotrophicum]